MACLLQLHFSPPLSSSAPVAGSATILAFRSPSLAAASASANPLLRLGYKVCSLQCGSVDSAKLLRRVGICEKRKVLVSASADDDSNVTGSLDLPLESSGDAKSVESLPLESKLQERLEQKLKMKLAKKIRQRRNRLLRKRRLRKKGRWPPSKMKKNKNV